MNRAHFAIWALMACCALWCSAQDAGPPPKLVAGESSPGVSMAIKAAVDEIPALADGSDLYFRVISITGRKSKSAEVVSVVLEVSDKPFDSPE